MRFVVLYYIAFMLLAAAISAVPVVWRYLSHIRAPAGPVHFHLWGTHGVRTLDLVVLGIEGVLVLLLSVTLITEFSRGHQG